MNLENMRRREMDIQEEQDGGTEMGDENYSDANMSDASIERGSKVIAGTVNVLKFRTLFSFCSQIKVCFLGWNSQNVSQNRKQGRR